MQMIAFMCFQQKFSPASDVLLTCFLWDTHRVKSTWLPWSQQENTDFKRVGMSNATWEIKLQRPEGNQVRSHMHLHAI